MLSYKDFQQFQGFFYDENIAKTIKIDNFEYEKKYIENKTDNRTAFLSFSKERRSIVNGRTVGWNDGNTIAKNNYTNIDLVVTESPIEELRAELPQFIVEDVWEFMLSLSKYLCEKRSCKVIVISGSVGKSSTRLMLDQVLTQDKILSNRGNHNTRFAIPLYLTKMVCDPTVVNLEVSLNALNNGYPGPLTNLIQPDIAILTSIGEAHLSTFTSMAQLSEYKARIFNGLKKEGLAIINKDMSKESFDIAYKRAASRTKRIKTYSMHSSDADISLVQFKELKKTTEVTIKYLNKYYTYYLGAASLGMIENSLAVILATVELGYSVDKCTQPFTNFQSLPKIMEITDHYYQGQEVTIIDDTHNASIPAMINAIETFKTKSVYYNGKKILVLGQVADLGKRSEELHGTLIPIIESAKADVVLGYGEFMKPVVSELTVQSRWHSNLRDLLQDILREVNDQSLILLKGSISHSDFYKISALLKKNVTSMS